MVTEQSSFIERQTVDKFIPEKLYLTLAVILTCTSTFSLECGHDCDFHHFVQIFIQTSFFSFLHWLRLRPGFHTG